MSKDFIQKLRTKQKKREVLHVYSNKHVFGLKNLLNKLKEHILTCVLSILKINLRSRIAIDQNGTKYLESSNYFKLF